MDIWNGALNESSYEDLEIATTGVPEVLGQLTEEVLVVHQLILPFFRTTSCSQKN